MKIIKGGITTAKGFESNGVSSGIKRGGKLDLALITANKPAVSAAVFTKSSIKAAPLIISEKHIKNNKLQAIVVNSGNANCFTGKSGLKTADQTTEIFGKLLNISKEDVFVLSTGIIGKSLSLSKIKNASQKLIKGLAKTNESKTAKAILTTDLTTKEIAVKIKLSGKDVIIGGCAKGSGMIAPNMATMLGFITTDVKISASLLKKSLKEATEQSFNSISIDGCMSTNDTVVLMASAQANNSAIKKGTIEHTKFQNGLNYVCLELAKMIVKDGEGATKFIEIEINGAKTRKQAKDIGLAIANSLLVKTACYGSDPNWGRIAAAIGSLGIKGINESNLKMDFSSFKKKEIKISVSLKLGSASNSVFTCDLSHKYININTQYN